MALVGACGRGWKPIVQAVGAEPNALRVTLRVTTRPRLGLTKPSGLW
jgi:hypothetical protein